MPNTSASSLLSSCDTASSKASAAAALWHAEADNIQSQIDNFEKNNSSSDTDLASKQATADSKKASSERSAILAKMKSQKSLASAMAEYFDAASTAFSDLASHTHPYVDLI